MTHTCFELLNSKQIWKDLVLDFSIQMLSAGRGAIINRHALSTPPNHVIGTPSLHRPATAEEWPSPFDPGYALFSLLSCVLLC
jgi:hypothetical protein